MPITFIIAITLPALTATNGGQFISEMCHHLSAEYFPPRGCNHKDISPGSYLPPIELFPPL